MPLQDLETLEALLPHRRPMLLLDRFVDGDHGEDGWARAEARIHEAHPFYEADRGVPSWALIEVFAQTAALIGGLQARQDGVPVPQGFLLGTRRFDCPVSHVPAGTDLVLEARTAFRDSNGMGAYHCRTLNEDLALACVLTVYAPPRGMNP
ncbi:MAG: hypothetical protein V2I57_01700 [Xanthomonadales bacterium]|jgi:predicted hotdog family 3-hydroxylacyl-ACP dehydratase|nr:hypothetical protein [Xanthomonadales bacterium]